MTPFRFGPVDRRLFGIHHPGSTTTSRAVLLCNPFGQEAVRCNRLFRVLSERLARNGATVLRFDAYGCGDSDGGDADFNVDGAAADLLAAHRELCRLAPSATVTWVGARLGATLAVLALSRVETSAPRLVLWDPIVDGVDYLRLLRVAHVQALQNSYSLLNPEWRRRLADEPSAFTEEAIGFAMSATLRAQLNSVTPQGLELRRDASTTVLVEPNDTPVRSWIAAQAQLGASVRLLDLHHEFEWTSEEALNTALVPGPVLMQLQKAVE